MLDARFVAQDRSDDKATRLLAADLEAVLAFAVFSQQAGVCVAVCAFALASPCPVSAGVCFDASLPSGVLASPLADPTLAFAIADEKLAQSLESSVAVDDDDAASCRWLDELAVSALAIVFEIMIHSRP